MVTFAEIAAKKYLIPHQPVQRRNYPSRRNSLRRGRKIFAHSPSPVLRLRGMNTSRISKFLPRAAISSGSQATTVEEQTGISEIIHLYRRPFLSDNAAFELLKKAQASVSDEIAAIETEQCFNIELSNPLPAHKLSTLRWLLQETFQPENLQDQSFFPAAAVVIEVGPRLSFTTAFSANAVSICRSASLAEVTRLERSRRYCLVLRPNSAPLTAAQLAQFAALVHDRMTESVYPHRLSSFQSPAAPEPVTVVPVVELGRAALEQINSQMGLAFDDQDLDYYTALFRDDLGRNPTNVELFDIAQSNSEHSRHWFFNGQLIVDGQPVDRTLFQIVKSTLAANPGNSVIGFKDNSSAIRGRHVELLRPLAPGSPSKFISTVQDMDVLFTAETHNFPCAVAPFPGAETGAGGRIRDSQATGRGSLVIASTAGYCVGNLHLRGASLPWEDPSFDYPSNLASPLQILIEASDGASDYGNKFGEPLIQGYTRTFGLRLPDGERREWVKPIMFSAGIGQLAHEHIDKGEPEPGLLVVKIGGPAYRIGMGGGAASSMVSGQNDADLDFNAVQRGDAEMAQKLYRVVRTCVEMGPANPIVSIHDQGAGGNCNVVKEIIYPEGARIDIRKVVVGDETMSVLEIWGAEYQEQDAVLIRPYSEPLLERICKRERVSMAVIGTISGDGKIVLVDGSGPPVVDLALEKVLGDMPQKRFFSDRVWRRLDPVGIPAGATVEAALDRVLRLPSVCSKRFLTTKVDRCVSGLVAQQQTVGPLQIPLADVAVVAHGFAGLEGAACAIGEQPIEGLLDPAAMARLAVGEALTNLVWAKVTSLADVKASGNWMYAAKLGGEGADMYDAAAAMAAAMIQLGIAIDGGKDSLSMAAATPSGELVKAPGNLVVSAYVTCPDITLTVTPDLKLPGDGAAILHLPIGLRRRLGGSALAHVYGQIGNASPDVDDVPYLKTVFEAVQGLIADRLLSAGHDVSDGGLVVAVLEMAFAGNCGVQLDLRSDGGEFSTWEILFAEELGLVLEVADADLPEVERRLREAHVAATVIGKSTSEPAVKVTVDGAVHVEQPMTRLRDTWEDTSFQLEALQRLPACVEKEKLGLAHRKAPFWALSFQPPVIRPNKGGPKVAILREEGSNGDREMAAAFAAAGFEPWDVAMADLVNGDVTLAEFRGIAFVGGFSYGDVLDSGKGWAGSIEFNPAVLEQFREFRRRPDTFSLGVCNGCQLMALLGWVGGEGVARPRFVRNESGRFECRFVGVKIQPSKAIMLKGMEGSSLGVWAAHGEGKAYFPGGEGGGELAPVRYCDEEGRETEEYPFNPNGSPEGVAALCSEDGRHLAMMPHPERCFMMWQWPWYPKNWAVEAKEPSPWLRMFQNAREWCG
ncbi:purine biosynthesis 4 [Wolffia australiana]